MRWARFCIDLLTGRPPFHAASLLETLRQVIDREPASPRSSNPEVTADLETICLKCLEKDAAERYASAQDLADDLRRFLATATRSWPAPSARLERAWRWCRRRPATAALAATVFLVLSVGVPVLAWLRAELAFAQAETKSAESMHLLALQQAKGLREAADAAQQLAATQEYFATANERGTSSTAL